MAEKGELAKEESVHAKHVGKGASPLVVKVGTMEMENIGHWKWTKRGETKHFNVGTWVCCQCRRRFQKGEYSSAGFGRSMDKCFPMS